MMLAYNTVAYVKQSIDSIVRQSYRNWELIISDDCSTDGTWELLTVLAARDARIQLYQTDANLGTARNRAATYPRLSGDLVCHVDSDDLLEPWSLEVMVDHFERYPAVQLFYSDFAQIGTRNEFHSYSPSPDFDANRLHQHGWRHFGMYRRSVMDHIAGYNDQILTCEDGDLFLQIAERWPCRRIAKVLYYYRSHGDNSSLKNKKCEDCELRPKCNYVRIWSKNAGYDPITFRPLEKQT